MADPPRPLGRPSSDAFDKQPDDWRVLWCERCLYAVTWDEETFLTYGWPEWQGVLDEAGPHDCSDAEAGYRPEDTSSTIDQNGQP